MKGFQCLVALLLIAALALATTVGEKKKPAKPVDVNTASLAELETLPGIGEAIALRIIRHREISGKFRSVDELVVIRGISRKKLEALRPYVTVKD